MAKSTHKQLPLPKRFSVSMTDAAYDRLRALNARTGLSNNYLLTILLERLDAFAEPGRLDAELDNFIREYGAPLAGAAMQRKPGDPDG